MTLLKQGDFEMGVMKTAAVKGLIPTGNKVGELRSNMFRLITEMPLVLEGRFEAEGLEAVAEMIAPGVKMELVRLADMNRACTKGLVYTPSDAE